MTTKTTARRAAAATHAADSAHLVDKQFAAAVDALGLQVTATPRLGVSAPDGFNGRPQCCGNAFCIPMCPIGAKYDATCTSGWPRRPAPKSGIAASSTSSIRTKTRDYHRALRRPDTSNASLTAKIVSSRPCHRNTEAAVDVGDRQAPEWTGKFQ